MLIDDFLPSYHVASHHELLVRAPADRAYQAIWQADLGSSFAVKVLLALRAVPALLCERKFRPPTSRRLTLRDLLLHGFCLLAEDPGREVVIGIAGRFWRLSGNLEPADPAEFRKPLPRGIARAVWSFVVSERLEPRRDRDAGGVRRRGVGEALSPLLVGRRAVQRLHPHADAERNSRGCRNELTAGRARNV